MSQQDNISISKMTNGKFASLLFITLFSVILIFSMAYYFYLSSLDKNLVRAEPYLEKISFNDQILRELGLKYASKCLASDKSCIVNEVYRNVVEKNQYIYDPVNVELIRTPENTLVNGGGDCEDLAILAASILENLNITTYLVLTSDHAYALACGVDASKIRDYGQASLKEVYAQKIQNETNLAVFIVNGEIFISSVRDENLKLGPHEAFFIQGGKESGFMSLKYAFASKDDFDFHVVLSKDEFDRFVDGKSFNYIKNCTITDGSCENLPVSSGVIIYNPSFSDIEVYSSINFMYHYDASKLFVNSSLSFYEIQNQTCVVLETTAGEYGFVGLASEDLVGEKLAFNSRTKEYVQLG